MYVDSRVCGQTCMLTAVCVDRRVECVLGYHEIHEPISSWLWQEREKVRAEKQAERERVKEVCTLARCFLASSHSILTRTRTHAHTHTHTHSITPCLFSVQPLMDSRALSLTHSHTHSLTHSLTHLLALSLTHTHTHSRIYNFIL